MEKYMINRAKGSQVTRIVKLRETGEVIGGIIPVYARGFLATLPEPVTLATGKILQEKMFGTLSEAGDWIYSWYLESK